MLVLDEFPAVSLLGPDGKIDAVRYPNFARLAATSTWFPNASTVYDSTPKAVPAILDAHPPAQRHEPRVRRPPEQRVHALRRHALPRHGGRGGLRAVPAARLPHALAHRQHHLEPEPRPRRAVRQVGREDRQLGQAELLLPPPAAPARALAVPPVGQGVPQRPARVDPRTVEPGRLPRPRHHTPEPPAASAPGGPRRPDAGRAARPARADRHLRQHADRGHLGPRDRVRPRRARPPHRHVAQHRRGGPHAVLRQGARPARRRA